MLTAPQQALIQAIEELDLEQVQRLLNEGLDPNFIDPEKGPPISVVCDGLFQWWEDVSEAYASDQPLTEQEKQQKLQPYLAILDALIEAKANLHLWDAEEFYGPLWDAASAACTPAIQRLLDHKVDPNTRDEEGQTILTSISELFFDCDFDKIDWTQSLPEEKNALELLRQNGAKMSKELI